LLLLVALVVVLQVLLLRQQRQQQLGYVLAGKRRRVQELRQGGQVGRLVQACSHSTARLRGACPATHTSACFQMVMICLQGMLMADLLLLLLLLEQVMVRCQQVQRRGQRSSQALQGSVVTLGSPV
jgi:hypothetical protein